MRACHYRFHFVLYPSLPALRPRKMGASAWVLESEKAT